MPNYHLIIEYDGTDFNGWGKQPGHRTVHGELETAFGRIFDDPINIICAGRTDKGVHATGQSVTVKLPETDPKKLILRLNSLLPQDISIKNIRVAEGLDARKSAKYKTYTYIIDTSPERSALWRNRAWHIPEPLNLSKMKVAAKLLQAKRDYSAFDSQNTVFYYKTVDLKEIKVSKHLGFVKIELTADHFLYKMVRKMVSEIVEIGKGNKTVKELKAVILSKDRSKTIKPAPAHGLYLIKVTY